VAPDGAEAVSRPVSTARVSHAGMPGGFVVFGMLYDIEDLADRAHAAYEAESRLRTKERARNTVLLGRHQLSIPPSMEGRAYPFKGQVLAGKRRIAKTLLMNKEGPQITVADFGTGVKAERDRAIVEEWQQGLFETMRLLHPTLEADLTDDNLVHSRSGLLVLPKPEAWCAAPQLDLTDLTTLDLPEIEGRYRWLREEQERYKLHNPPIYWRHVPAESMILRDDPRGGLAEAFIIEQMPVLQILDLFRDTAGKPAAKHLAASVERQAKELTLRDTATVCTYLDRQHYQIAILDLFLEVPESDRMTLHRHGTTEEIVWEGEHGMDEVPLALFHGETWASDDPAVKYQGFFDRTIAHQVALDELMTQAFSNVRVASWVTQVIERAQDAPLAAAGAGDSPPPIVLAEGAVNDVLGPGEKLGTVAWMDSSSHQWLRESVNYLVSQIDELTIPKAAIGQTNASSGYEYALVSSQAENNLRLWQWGMEDGWAHACRLTQKAAVALLRQGFDPIPVRYVSEDGVRSVALTPELAERDWQYAVTVRIQQVGGEMALVQTLTAAEQAGYLTHLDAMARFGVRNPLRTMEEVIEQRIVQSDAILQMLTEAVQQRTLAQINAAIAPNAPQQPVLPDGLAGILQSPALQARLPEGFMSQAATGTQAGGGLPGVAGPDLNPVPPTIGEGEDFRRRMQMLNGGRGAPGGGVMGQGQTLPGGMAQMSQILGRQG
jgi:hypothetical protein